MTICVEIIKSECYNYLNYNFFSKPLNKTIIKDCLSESTLHLQIQPRGYLGEVLIKLHSLCSVISRMIMLVYFMIKLH